VVDRALVFICSFVFSPPLEELSAPELKKLQRKERKAQHKAAQAKAMEEKKGEFIHAQQGGRGQVVLREA